MAFEIKHGRLASCKVLCDTAAEQPVEGEYTVPDYCPQVETIVKCVARPVVVQSVAAGMKLTVEGYVAVTVYYVSGADGMLYTVALKLPFSRQLELAEAAGRFSYVWAGLQPQYFNCRAAGARKLEFRAAYTLYARVLGEFEREVVSLIEGDGAQQKTETAEFITAEAATEKRFTAEDVLTTGEQGEGARVLSLDVVPQLGECAQSMGEITASGSITARAQLELVNGQLLEKRFELPFYQMTDAAVPEGADEVKPEARLIVYSAQARVSQEEPWELAAEVSAVLDAALYGTVRESYASDVFSSEYETEAQSESFNILSGLERYNTSAKAEKSFTLEAAAELAAWELVPLYCALDEQTARAYVQLYAMLRSPDGQMNCAEYPLELELPEFSGLTAQQLHTAELSVANAQVTLQGAVLTVKFTLSAECSAETLREVAAVTAVYQNAPRTAAADAAALTVYYADAGEPLWDIAKRYGASVENIASINGLSGGELAQRTMLLIPTV